MRINSFFKTLNRKINKYDKMATNPFTDASKMVIVWVEDATQDEECSIKKYSDYLNNKKEE